MPSTESAIPELLSQGSGSLGRRWAGEFDLQVLANGFHKGIRPGSSLLSKVVPQGGQRGRSGWQRGEGIGVNPARANSGVATHTHGTKTFLQGKTSPTISLNKHLWPGEGRGAWKEPCYYINSAISFSPKSRN